MSSHKSTQNLIAYSALSVGLFFFGSLALYFIYLQPRASIAATQNWMPTECEILSLKLVGSGTARLDIHYRYAYQGQTYESTRYDLLLAESGEDAWAREAYVNLSQSDHTTCFVNPDDPTQAVIDRQRQHPQIGLIIPSIFLGIGLIFALLTISELRNLFLPRTQDAVESLSTVSAQGTGTQATSNEATVAASRQHSGAVNFFGWLLGFALAIIFFLVMDGVEHTRALVYGPIDWIATDGSVDWSRSSGTRVLGSTVEEYQVRYSVDGVEYTSRCYSMGSPDKESIEYDREHPWRGRLQGTKLTATPALFLIFPVGLFSLLALGLLAAVMRYLPRATIPLGILIGMAVSINSRKQR